MPGSIAHEGRRSSSRPLNDLIRSSNRPPPLPATELADDHPQDGPTGPSPLRQHHTRQGEMVMGQTRRAFRLALASWDIVSRDPALLVLPLMSAVSILTVMILLFVPAGLLFSSNHSQGTFLIFSLLAVYPLTLVGVFFRFAFVLVLAGRLDGRNTSIGDGLQSAWGRRASIASWAGIA